MPHVFDGPWRSTLIGDEDSRRELPFQLEIDPGTGNLKPSSTHGGVLITGNATTFHIEMTQTDLIPGITLKYVGDLAGEVVVHGTRHLVVRGTFTLITPGLVPDIDFENIEGLEPFRHLLRRLRAQEQEIWVATKP